jgi:predicted NBD/HSP70 family sugar kinase
MGVPGNVDPVKGCTRYLPNFGWLEPVELGKLLINKVDMHDAQVRLRNDGRCAALAESKYGAGIGAAVFAMLTLGTGIGGALIINGKLFDGSSFDAGDFGHHVIRSGTEDAMQCVCGKRGCFETHASAQGLVRQYKRHGGEAENAEAVLTAMRAGTPAATKAFEVFLDDLATGIANLVTFYNPDVIALGGGLAQAAELYVDLQQRVDDKTLPATRGRCRIVPSTLGPDAGAIGAAILSLEYLEGEF